FGTHAEDNVRVKARLSAPAYCYLIALNPDGTVQLCPKAQTDTPPRPISEIVFPTESEGYHGLTDGTGLQAFVLVASRRPLPAFVNWPPRAELPWKPVTAEGIWRFDRGELTFLGDPKRGTERQPPSPVPEPLAAVCQYLSHRPDVDAIRAIAFPVLAAKPAN